MTPGTTIVLWAFCLVLLIGLPRPTISVSVLRFQENRMATESTRAIYKGDLDDGRKLNSITLCARFKLYIIHGWATFLHLRHKGVLDYLLVADLWVERVRPVFARNWNFQILKKELWMYRWYHICFTYDHRQHLISTYMDGELNNNQDYDVGRPIYGDHLTLGQDDGPYRSFSGELTQVNIWDRALEAEEIRSMALCERDPQGNYVSWEVGWELFDVDQLELPLSELCQKETGTTYFWFPALSFSTAQYLCQALGTHLPRVTENYEIASLHEASASAYPNVTCHTNFWTELNDRREEGVWRSQDGQIQTDIIWAPQEPNGLNYENCGVLNPSGISDVDCETDRYCVLCIFTDQQRYSLLGICESELRNVYFMPFQTRLGEVFFMGYGEYRIIKEKETWAWINDVTKQTIAYMEEAEPDYPMGRRLWRLEQQVCSQRPGGKRLLLLSPCSHDHFTCDDATCIPLENRCDLRYDCRDNSDELECQMVEYPKDYQHHLPPRSSESEDESLRVILSTRMESLTVDTLEMSMSVYYEITLTWEDNRLQFLNLKRNNTLNILPFADVTELWTPIVGFVNTNDNQHTVVDEEVVMFVSRDLDFSTRDKAAPAEVDVYSGAGNPLSLGRKYGSVYTCDLDLALYPFDKQRCFMRLRLSSALKSFLVFDPENSSVVNTANNLLLEYQVGQVWMEHDNSGMYSEVRIFVPLTRRSGYAILNIYIPTMVLLLVSYFTLFFNYHNFDVRMMSALTVQLVIATLFSQVSSSLPKTSYFKMVDVWFLFCIGITFLVITFHALVDFVINKEKEETPVVRQSWSEPINGGERKRAGFVNMKDYWKVRERVIAATKGVVLVSFVIFNLAYWGYIFW